MVNNELKELPEKWYIVWYTKEICEAVRKYFNKSYMFVEGVHNEVGNEAAVDNNNKYYRLNSDTNLLRNHTEISFEQFKKWVLKEPIEDMEDIIYYTKGMIHNLVSCINYACNNTAIAIVSKYFYNANAAISSYNSTPERLATPEELKWYKVCCNEGKFIEKENLINYDDNGKKLENKFEVGKWYEILDNNNKWYLKYSHTEIINLIDGTFNYNKLCGETIGYRGVYDKSGYWANTNFEKNCTLLTDLSEIQKYLPDNHPDKINKQLTVDDLVEGEALNTTSINIFGLIEEAKKRYNDGDKFAALNTYGKPTGSVYTINTNFKSWNSDTCVANGGDGLIYANGKWAEIVESAKEEQWIPKVGDWIVSLIDRPNSRKQGDVFQIIDFTNDKQGVYYLPNTHGNLKTFRPAKPHEIPKTISTVIEGDNFIVKHVKTNPSVVVKHFEQQQEIKKQSITNQLLNVELKQIN